MQSSTLSPYTAEKAVDSDEDTFSQCNTVQKDDANNFDGMTPWWKVTFEREVLVQSVEIVNAYGEKMSNFNIRVGNVDLYTSLAQNALCKSNLQWVNPTRNTYTCTQATQGKYLYITNGFNGPVSHWIYASGNKPGRDCPRQRAVARSCPDDAERHHRPQYTSPRICVGQ